MAGRRRTALRVLTDTCGYSDLQVHRRDCASISAESLGRSARAFDDADNRVAPPPPFTALSAATKPPAVPSNSIKPPPAVSAQSATGGYSDFASGRSNCASISAESLGRSVLFFDDVDNRAAPPPPFTAPSAATKPPAVPSNSIWVWPAVSAQSATGSYSALMSGGAKSAKISDEFVGPSARVFGGVGSGVAPPPPSTAPSAQPCGGGAPAAEATTSTQQPVDEASEQHASNTMPSASASALASSEKDADDADDADIKLGDGLLGAKEAIVGLLETTQSPVFFSDYDELHRSSLLGS